jgi:holo-[acyl-carrier protein] synthase
MILGTGIDLVEVGRVVSALERFGDRFVARILLPDEIAYCRGFRHPAPHVAARFAAKEAVSKAFGTGIGSALGWHDVEIVRRDSGEPVVVLHGRGRDLLARRGGRHVLVSLTHTQNHAAAVAILESLTGARGRPASNRISIPSAAASTGS